MEKFFFFFLQQYLCHYLFFLGTSKNNTLDKKSLLSNSVSLFEETLYNVSVCLCKQASIRNFIFLLLVSPKLSWIWGSINSCVCIMIPTEYTKRKLIFKKCHTQKKILVFMPSSFCSQCINYCRIPTRRDTYLNLTLTVKLLTKFPQTGDICLDRNS